MLLLREQSTVEKFAEHLGVSIAGESRLAISLHGGSALVALEMAAIWTEEPNLASLGHFDPLCEAFMCLLLGHVEPFRRVVKRTSSRWISQDPCKRILRILMGLVS